jgi:hypothetical protein
MKFVRTGDRLFIGNIEVTASSLINTYKAYYPKTWEQISSQNLFHYVHLFGIRASTDNAFAADDIVGALRITNANYYEIANSRATTEPGTKALAELYDAEARRRGGAAYMKEGQHAYSLIPRRASTRNIPADRSGFVAWSRDSRGRSVRHRFSPHAFFCPINPVPVYGWRPNAVVRTTKNETEWLKTQNIGGKTYKGFKDSLDDFKRGRASNIIDSTSRDTCIHRAFGRGQGVERYDSAGCQVLKDNLVLNTMGDWALEHLNKKYSNTFIYTLFTGEQFINANSKRPFFLFDFTKIFG